MSRPSQGEALAVWAIALLDVLAVLVTYSRVDPHDLHVVTGEGISGGLGRALVQLDFPHVAGAAVPLVLLALAVLPRRAWFVGAPAIALCVVFAWPGVVDNDDLDPKLVNALPALGVALALGLTVAAVRVAGAAFAPRQPGDRLRIGAAVAVALLSLPWLAAELGFYFGAGVYLTDEPYREPGERVTAAVHLGHHHGLMGALLVLQALLLTRRRLPGAMGRAYGLLVALALVYGTANMVQDAWHEQILKRGWTDYDIPSVTTPSASAMWALVLIGTLATYALVFARPEPEPAIIG